MNKIYIVFKNVPFNIDDNIECVFNTKEKAIDYIKKNNKPKIDKQEEFASMVFGREPVENIDSFQCVEREIKKDNVIKA